MDRLHRTKLLYGNDAIAGLKESCVAVFGLGGVGGHAAESIARSGVGKLVIADRDVVDITNINRQLVANAHTVGQNKTDVMMNIINNIDPEIKVATYTHSFKDDYDIVFLHHKVDAVIDCIDDVAAKVNLICYCKQNGIPIISSMGTALRKRPEMLQIIDIYKTEGDPLARIMRSQLRKRGVEGLSVVCSKEQAMPRTDDVLASCAFVPAAAGLVAASAVLRFLTGETAKL